MVKVGGITNHFGQSPRLSEGSLALRSKYVCHSERREESDLRPLRNRAPTVYQPGQSGLKELVGFPPSFCCARAWLKALPRAWPAASGTLTCCLRSYAMLDENFAWRFHARASFFPAVLVVRPRCPTATGRTRNEPWPQPHSWWT